MNISRDRTWLSVLEREILMALSVEEKDPVKVPQQERLTSFRCFSYLSSASTTELLKKFLWSKKVFSVTLLLASLHIPSS